jgi:hypothetical protein
MRAEVAWATLKECIRWCMLQFTLSALLDELHKIAALGGDLRVSSIPGQKMHLTRPPTEESKRFSFNLLKNTQRLGNIAKPGSTPPQPKGPRIDQIAARP